MNKKGRPRTGKFAFSQKSSLPATEGGLFSSLRRRFQQTQDDVSYTVMALLPTLGDQILEYMDVEAITKELQSRSKIRNARQQSQAPSSLASSIDVVQEHDVRSDSGSIAPSVASTGFSFGDPDSTAATAPQVVSQPSESARDHLSSSVVASSTSSAISGENLSLHSSQLVRHCCVFLKTIRVY